MKCTLCDAEFGPMYWNDHIKLACPVKLKQEEEALINSKMKIIKQLYDRWENGLDKFEEIEND